MTTSTWAAQRAITAEHEAAHALLYLLHGYPIHRIEIEPDMITLSTPEPTMRPTRDLAVISMAGMVIEARHRDDFDLNAEMAEACEWVEYGDDPAELGDMEVFATHPWLAHAAFRSASLYLEEHRDDHERLTAALMASDGHLTGADVAALDLAVTRHS